MGLGQSFKASLIRIPCSGALILLALPASRELGGFRDGFAPDCLLHRRVCELSVPERRTRHLRSGLCARRHFLFAAVQSVHRGLVTLQVLLSSPVVLVVVDELRIDIPGGFIGAFGVQILVLFGVRLARIGVGKRDLPVRCSADHLLNRAESLHLLPERSDLFFQTH